jgi:hypothetical protein
MAKAQIADKAGLGEIEIGIRGNGGAGNGK